MFAETTPLFADRSEVGRRLATRLLHYRGSDGLVIALPRGGVVVGYEIAQTLDLPLDLLIVRKIGHPRNPELGVGAVVEGLPPQLDQELLRTLHISSGDLRSQIEVEQQEVSRRAQLYRGGLPFPEVKGKTLILVDDGVATGNTARAAIASLRFRGARRVVLALGVAPPGTARELRRLVEEFVCLATPSDFAAVGQFYHAFDQVEDEEVLELLHLTRGRARPDGGSDG